MIGAGQITPQNLGRGSVGFLVGQDVGQDGDRYIPYVIEPAVSIERIFVAMLCDAYDEEVVGERERTVLRLHPAVAPVKAAVLPLVPRDEGMSGRARALFEELRRSELLDESAAEMLERMYV